MKTTHHLATAVLALAASGGHAADALIASPDGRVAIRIADDGSQFSVSRRGEAVKAGEGPVSLAARKPLGLRL